MLHAVDASLRGSKRIKIRTVETDVVVLAVRQFQRIGARQVWIDFGTGNAHRFIAIHELALH
jgi:hypothetical protein